ncbi:cyclin-A2 isoform X1 [Hylaeus anthracinus]|uniref:cyclin-A2 isoform X1 n=1 Tax=Hylaeus volcanicus TaxID=313075 RepID=UPI0023B7A7AE|nr:cyclin-A2 isoform X1 [Hylaeus volcanicus]XP_053995762.1 cyclin-A2 isoform X1 [Hylaeus anthracinus]
MATIRVHEDQENRIVDIRRGKDNITVPLQSQTLQPTKRAVLGVLHNNCTRNPKTEIYKDDKYPKTKAVIPTQFEPFKIYEEKKEEVIFKIYEDKLEEETSVALRDIKDKKEINEKHDVKSEREKPRLEVNSINISNLSTFCNAIQDINQKKQNELIFSHDSPMSLEKSIPYSSSKKELERRRESIKEMRMSFFDVDEYRADIYNYLRAAETQHRPKPGYMKKQPDITYSMRSILVDWLVEVAEEYRLQTETLYLAVSYIDRFLSYMSVVRAKLQLVGTAAMFIAAKYEEIYPPDVGEFVYITDDTYTKKQVLRMEHLILRVLSLDLTVPTPLVFLMEYCISNNLPEKIKFLAMYLCELSMLEGDPYLQFLPSHLAASAVALARHTLLEEMWPHELELSTGYRLKDLKECIICLNKTFCNALNIQQQAIQDKYKSNKYGHVALLLPRRIDHVTLTSEDEEEA